MFDYYKMCSSGMYSTLYKGVVIHRYCATSMCKVNGKVFKSYRAAQIAITKGLKNV